MTLLCLIDNCYDARERLSVGLSKTNKTNKNLSWMDSQTFTLATQKCDLLHRPTSFLCLQMQRAELN